jgi:hypothetical protein
MAAERNHERQLLESTKRERQLAEERATTELGKARLYEAELNDAKRTITELRTRKDELVQRLSDYDAVRNEADRLRLSE